MVEGAVIALVDLMVPETSSVYVGEYSDTYS